MELPRLNESVVRVTRLDRTSTGAYTPVVLFEGPQATKKKGSRIFRELERAQLRAISAGRTFLDTYSRHHEESNAKRKDGWVIDMAPNLLEAGIKASKKLKLFWLPVL
jgi:hypothetical protein